MPGLQNFLAFSCQYHSLPSHWNKDWGTTFHLHHQWCFSDDATWDHGGTRDFPGKLLQCWSFFLPFPPLPIIMFLGSLLTSDCMLGNENIPFSLANCIGDEKTKVYSLLELCIKQEQIGPWVTMCLRVWVLEHAQVTSLGGSTLSYFPFRFLAVPQTGEVGK